MNKYVKVLFGDASSADSSLHYKIDEVNETSDFNPEALDAKSMGGFNFSTPEKILRWLVRGDTLYDVSFPDDAEIISPSSKAAPNGVYRTNKIIISNPQKITDDLALYLYEKSDLPLESYYKSLAGLMIRGHYNTALRLIRDKVNKDNIEEVLYEINDFYVPDASDEKANLKVYNDILDVLNEIQSDLLVCINVDKDAYVKKITDDKVINITGESGSGKSYYSNKYKEDNNYVIIDVDNLFNDDSLKNDEIKNLFISKYGDDFKNKLIEDFDDCYEIILNHFKDSSKTVVIVSAHLRYMKNLSKLKGTVIVLRTSVDLCFNRAIDRYNRKHPSSTKADRDNFKYKKKKIYTWYKVLNNFLTELDKL